MHRAALLPWAIAAAALVSLCASRAQAGDLRDVKARGELRWGGDLQGGEPYVFEDEREPGVLKGKTAYMSPEQARAERVSRRTDIYSLGVVFHELLTARPLHGAARSMASIPA